MLFRIIALKIFAKLPRKNPWWNLLFISLLVGNCDIFRTTTFPKSFGRLLLNFYQDSRNYQPKAAVPRCSVKKVFLEISQNFAKFLRTPFYTRTPLVAASDQPPVHQDLPFSVFAMPDNVL